MRETKTKKRSLANAKVSAYSNASMKALSKEIYGKSTQGTCEKYIQWVATLSLTIRVYLHSFSCCCLPDDRSVTFSKYSNL